MEKEILQNNFEAIYKEYKDYESYIVSIKDETIAQRDKFKARVAEGKEDNDTLIQALFNLSIKPVQSEADLRILRDRLINVYDAYKIVLDFPEEVKEEVKNLKRPEQAYTISNGEHKEIDKDKNNKYREEVRKTHSEIINSLKTN